MDFGLIQTPCPAPDHSLALQARESDMNRSFGQVLTLLVMMLTLVAVASAGHANIPAGTNLQVRISEKLTSETANVGDHFHGALTAPVVANGRTLFPRGAEVTGEV